MARARIEIFTGPNCAFCAFAKATLTEKGLAFEEYDISEPEHMREYVSRLPRSKSIPQIFIDGEHIGNEEDLSIMDRDGRLDELVAGG